MLGTFSIWNRIGALGEEQRHLGGGQPSGEEVEEHLRGLRWGYALEVGQKLVGGVL